MRPRYSSGCNITRNFQKNFHINPQIYVRSGCPRNSFVYFYRLVPVLFFAFLSFGSSLVGRTVEKFENLCDCGEQLSALLMLESERMNTRLT